jgi:peptide deformylase
MFAYDLYARYILHENDHLDGILSFQRAKKTEDIVFQLYETEEPLD